MRAHPTPASAGRANGKVPGATVRRWREVNAGEETKMAAETPTIVLVHGAWADATGFDAEIRALGAVSYTHLTLPTN